MLTGNAEGAATSTRMPAPSSAGSSDAVLRLINADEQHPRGTYYLAESAQLIVLLIEIALVRHEQLRCKIEKAAALARLRQAEARVPGLQLQRLFVDQASAGENQQRGWRGSLGVDADGYVEALIFPPPVRERPAK